MQMNLCICSPFREINITDHTTCPFIMHTPNLPKSCQDKLTFRLKV